MENSEPTTPDRTPQQLTLGPRVFTPAAARAYDALDASARARLEQDARAELKVWAGRLGPAVFEQHVQDQVRLYLQDARVRALFKVG